MDYPINGYVVLEIFNVVGYVVHENCEEETLSTSTGEDDICVLELCYFTSLGTPYTVTHENSVYL